jgi:protein SCO1
MRTALILALVASILPGSVILMQLPSDTQKPTSQEQPLPKIGPAPGFALTSQDGAHVSLTGLNGKVVAVTFILTLCSDLCPVLTPMMSLVQDQLGQDFGTKVAFVSITIDPERDTPEMLKLYAQMHGADLAGWSFLTGSPSVIRDLTRRYGVFASKNANGDVDHSFLTSIVDKKGILRVQYLGVRFDPKEFRQDLLSLMKES